MPYGLVKARSVVAVFINSLKFCHSIHSQNLNILSLPKGSIRKTLVYPPKMF